MQNRIAICKIVRPHGIKGAVKVLALRPINMPFFALKRLYVGQNFLQFEVEKVQELNGAYIIYLKGISSIEQAEKLRNMQIYIDKNDYAGYFSDSLPDNLTGIEVVDFSGEQIGFVVAVNNYGYQDIISINCSGVTYDIPYIEDILKLDEKANRLVIDRKKFLEVRV